MGKSVLEENYLCLEEIVRTAYEENINIKKALLAVSNYLTTDSMVYMDILSKYPNTDKRTLRALVTYNFLKLNHYRKNRKVEISSWRAKLLDLSRIKTVHMDEYACADRKLFSMVLNDALISIYEISPTIEREIVNMTISDGYSRILGEIYPLVTEEFDDAINVRLSRKELILLNMSDILFEEYERIIFSKGKSTEVSTNLIGEVVREIKNENKNNPITIPSLARKFEKQSGISTGEEYNSVLLAEMFWSTINTKKELGCPVSFEEEDLFNNLNQMNINRQNMRRFCVRNCSELFESLMDSFTCLTEDVFLEEHDVFDQAKKDSYALAKKNAGR